MQPTTEYCHPPKAEQDGLHRRKVLKLQRGRLIQQWQQLKNRKPTQYETKRNMEAPLHST
jgi:hypothetical protein